MKGLLWILCYGVWPLMAFLLRPFYPRRVAFEKRNKKEDRERAFSGQADLAFEISSEGEFEQIQFFLEELLKEGRPIELVYCSPSVEKNVEALGRQYPRHVKTLRLPLLTVNPWGKQSALTFLSAPVLILSRYDLFPELLLYGMTKAKRFILLSGSLKGKGQGLQSFFYGKLFSLFDEVIPATALDRKRFEQLLNRPIAPEMDLRVLRIQHRLDHAMSLFRQREMGRYLHFIEQWPRENRLLLGQFYASELSILDHPALWEDLAKKKFLLCLCPHDLENREINRMTRGVEDLGEKRGQSLPLQVLGPQDFKNSSFGHFHLLKVRGILCEFYQFFNITYIGGGFNRSIHSVLEPYLAGSRVICGPKIHRSSEFELIFHQERDSLAVLSKKEDFFSVYDNMKKAKERGRSEKFVSIMKQRYQQFKQGL